ncbi:MAG: hypothetical protein HFJ53_07865 [Clostridia bacterium]|jgi:hypothetical protein|nr:hypothetical protein [Clostridia bacterium]
MTKKIFTFIIIVAFILFTSSVFATNELNASMNKSADNIRNAVSGTENVIRDGASAIGSGIQDLGNTFKDGAARVTQDTTPNNNDNNGYRAVRTATDGSFMGMSGSTWTWFILGLAALAIVGLVWYYAMQNNTDYSKDHGKH